jgi:hypothetical protein
MPNLLRLILGEIEEDAMTPATEHHHHHHHHH